MIIISISHVTQSVILHSRMLRNVINTHDIEKEMTLTFAPFVLPDAPVYAILEEAGISFQSHQRYEQCPIGRRFKDTAISVRPVGEPRRLLFLFRAE